MKCSSVHRASALVVALLLWSLFAVPAYAGGGTANLKGRLTIVAKGCGRHAGTARAAFALSADGTWSVAILNGALTGTSAPLDATGRKLGLDFDVASLGAIGGIVAEDVTDICHRPAQLIEPTKDAMVLAFNKKFTRVKLTVRYHFTGASGQKPAIVREVIVMRGHWVPA